MATAATIKPSSFRPQPSSPSRGASQAKHNRSARPADQQPLLKPKPAATPIAAGGSGTVTTTTTAATTTTITASSPAVSSRLSTITSAGSTCDACYRRKSRCAMNESVNKCYSCDFHRQDCTFTISSQLGKRKLDEASLDGSESAKRPATASSASPIPGGSMAGMLHRSPAPMNPGPPALPREDHCLASQHIGMTTELEPLLLDYLSLDHNGESPLSTSRVRKVGDEGTFMRISDGPQSRTEMYAISLEAIENLVTPFGPTLVDKYFHNIHPTFPVLMEESFRNAYQTKRTLNPALLAAVYLVTLKWLDSGPSVQMLRKPDAPRLEAMASKLLTESLSRPHIATVQAGLILSQKSPFNTPLLISQLVAVGFDLGLHQDCSSWRMEEWEKGIRKRLAWALYVQDKWCSLMHGRPAHIFSANWTVKELSTEDFVDVYSPQRRSAEGGGSRSPGPLLFRNMVTLTSILSDILDTFYTLKAANDFSTAGPQRTRMILERAKPIQIRLKDWFSRLPEELKMDLNGGEHASFNGSLHLAYFATEITLHRCIIRSISPGSTDSYLSHICRSAAKTRLISAMDFVNRLRPMHLRSFWPSASRTNFALISAFGTLLRATAVTHEEEEFYRMRLNEYRWTLSVSCKDAEFLTFAIDSLDVASCLLRNVPDKPELEELIDSNQGAYQQPQEYPMMVPRQHQHSEQQYHQGNGMAYYEPVDEDIEEEDEDEEFDEEDGDFGSGEGIQIQHHPPPGFTSRAMNAGRAGPSVSGQPGLASPANTPMST